MGTCIGKGSFATIRMVTLRVTDEMEAPPPMVLKIMKKYDLLRTYQVEHVKSEKQVLEMVDCPFIITFLSSFQDDRRVFLLLEYAHGGELYRRLKIEGRLPVDHSKFYAAEIVLAFQYLHELDIIYRDLKPENVLFDVRGHIKLVDFGFAKVVKNKTATLVGTPEYLAPEIIRGEPHSRPVDWWALGVVIYEMLTGYPPFFDAHPFGVYKRIMTLNYHFPRHFDVKAKHLCRNLIMTNQEERYGHVEAVMHQWFDFVDWRLILDLAIWPPYVPPVEGKESFDLYELIPFEQANDTFDDALPIPRRHKAVFDAAF